jgi:hypothetical protein
MVKLPASRKAWSDNGTGSVDGPPLLLLARPPITRRRLARKMHDAAPNTSACK